MADKNDANNTDDVQSLSAVGRYIPDSQCGDITETIEVEDDFRAPDALLEAQALANTLDTAVKIPFIGIRVGLDFLIGLIPLVGDFIMLLASLRIVRLGNKLGLPSPLRHKMMLNAVIDYCLGFIPVVGDIIDLFYKANMRNVRIMEQWWVSQNKDKIDALAKRQFAQWEQEQSLQTSQVKE